jgi:predicted DNA-binding transcriptional regulator AlpA
MRKRLKKKKRSCALCKPHKIGKALRWKAADYDKIVNDEKEIRKTLRQAG